MKVFCQVFSSLLVLALLLPGCKKNEPDTKTKPPKSRRSLCAEFCQKAAQCRLLRKGYHCQAECDEMLQSSEKNQKIFKKVARDFSASCEKFGLMADSLRFVLTPPAKLATLPSLPDRPRSGIRIRVSKTALFADDKVVAQHLDYKLDPFYKQGHAASFLIDPLKDLLTRAKKKRSPGSRKPVVAQFLLTPGVTYRLLLELVYTAGRATYRQFDFRVNTPAGPRVLQLDTSNPPPQKAQTITIEVTKSGLRLSPPAAKTAATLIAGRRAGKQIIDDLPKLYRALLALRKANPTVQILGLAADPGVRWQRFAMVWAAVAFDRGIAPFKSNNALLSWHKPGKQPQKLFATIQLLVLE